MITNHFELVDALLGVQPAEYTACFKHKAYFEEYGYRSTGTPGFRWVWIKQRLLTEKTEELQRLYELAKP